MTRLTQARVRHLFTYNPRTGHFHRRIDVHSGRFKAGEYVGSPDKTGYLTMFVDGKSYKTHRIAWLYVNGEWPVGKIDHVNGNRSDNRISNLRLASRSQQCANSKMFSTNTSGYKGVYKYSRQPGWWAFIEWNRKRIWLGSYPTFEDAVAARKAAELKYFGKYARPL